MNIIKLRLRLGHTLLCTVTPDLVGRVAIHALRVWVINSATSGIILGTHREKGAHTFWSYALGLPLAGSSVLSWKFCHVLHKVLRDGHANVRRQLFLFLRSIDVNSA